jgi:DNA-binding transcriptional ArsR family regulator
VAAEGDHSHPVDPERVARAREHVLSSAEAEQVAELFRLLGDSVRARIVSALTAADEMCVGDIALAIAARENAVSYALRQLRSAGLVQRRRRGREIYYTLADRRPADLLELARRGAP